MTLKFMFTYDALEKFLCYPFCVFLRFLYPVSIFTVFDRLINLLRVGLYKNGKIDGSDNPTT